MDGPKRQGTQSDPPSSVTFLAAQSHLAHQIDLASNASSILLALQKLSTSLAVSESIALGAAKSESFLAKARELLSLKELAEAIKADEDERGADAGLGGAEKGKEGEEGGRVASMVTTTRLELAKHVDEMAVLIRQQAIAAELFVRKTSTEKRLGREKSIRLAKEEASQQDEKVEGAREGLANVVRCGKRR